MTGSLDVAVNKIGILLVALMTAVLLLGGVVFVGSVDVSPTDYVSSGEVVTSEGSMHLDRAGQPTVVGEIENDVGSAIGDVEVAVTFYEDDEEIDTVRVQPLVNPVPDRTTVPFSARLLADGDPDSYDVEVSYDEVDGYEDDELELVDAEEYNRGQDSVTIIGEVENAGDSPAERPRVVVTFYDRDGNVIGVRTDRVSPSPLDPGESGEFRTQYSTLGNVPSLARDYDSYRVVVHDDS